MSDINLLPEEFRDNEIHELKSVKNKPKDFDIKLSQGLAEKPQIVKPVKSGWLGRLFTKKLVLTKAIIPPAKPKEKIIPVVVAPVDFVSNLPPKPASSPQPMSPALPLIQKPEVSQSATKDQPQVTKSSKPSFWSRWPKPARPKMVTPPLDKSKAETAAAKDGGLDINLMPQELVYPLAADWSGKIKFFGAGVSGFIILMVLVYFGITWYQLKVNQKIQQFNTEIEDYNTQIARYELSKTAAVDLQARLKLIQGLINGHIYWTKFFSFLEKYTVPDVYYTNFSMAGTQKLVLSAVGRDYESVARQLVAFQQASDFVSEVTVNSASAKIDDAGNYAEVNFNIDLVILPSVFQKPIK